MADLPVFYDRNWLDKASTLAVSSNDTDKARLYDRSSDPAWITSGENSDLTTSSIAVLFIEDGVAAMRTVDTVVLLGTNAKSGKVQYWTGAAWADVTGGAYSAVSTDYKVITFTGVAATGFRVLIDTTQTANQEKEVGELLLLTTLVTVASTWGPRTLDQSHEPVVLASDMADGGKDITLRPWAGSRTSRWRCRLRFEFISSTQADYFIDTLQPRAKVYVRPEPETRPERFYFVSVVEAALPEAYSNPNWKGAGYTVDLDLSEN